METPMLLESYLKQLRLPTFLRNYRQVAEEAAQANLDYDRFLLALAEQEVAQREKNRQTQFIRSARFPVLKELVQPGGSNPPVFRRSQTTGNRGLAPTVSP